MKIYYGLRDPGLKKKDRSIAIGIFDGVHRGHQKILDRVLSQARRRGTSSMAITFDPHPCRVLKPRSGCPILISPEHRLKFFERLGLSEALVIRFTRGFSEITRERFLHDTLIRRLGMRALVVGHDFCFGKKALGDADYLKASARACGFGLTLVDPLKLEGRVVSSTRIRRSIEHGDFRKAQAMLGRPVSVYGTVVRGRGRGKSLGFPTANLNPHHETLPPAGVYAAWGYLNGKVLKGVVHIGARPTFRDLEKTLEVHFLNFHGDIYGKDIELLFVDSLRKTRRFQAPRKLASAIRGDIAEAMKILKKTPPNSLYKGILSGYTKRS
ncbi:MAG: bifunctional riboflavin kinase/FAD synthetase [Candidatus Omnitrophica bacterium]|nr:bifunctional riboflavin kinase/FAD synthetase [Candidatus Omnitrophota bacterium]